MTSVKDAIVQILSREWPISSKKLFNRAKTEFSLTVSYQAFHKSLKELKQEKKVQEKNKEYSLSVEWVNKLKKFYSGIEDSYLEKTKVKGDINKLEFFSASFDTVNEFSRFILDEACKIEFKEKPAIMHFNSVYPLIGISGEDIKFIEKRFSGAEHYILCRQDTLMDKLFGKQFEKFGAKVKYGVNCAEFCDIYISGDHVVVSDFSLGTFIY